MHSLNFYKICDVKRCPVHKTTIKKVNVWNGIHIYLLSPTVVIPHFVSKSERIVMCLVLPNTSDVYNMHYLPVYGTILTRFLPWQLCEQWKWWKNKLFKNAFVENISNSKNINTCKKMCDLLEKRFVYKLSFIEERYVKFFDINKI